MKLKKLQINGFGNIENKSLELSEGINILYGKNESGKSTITNFIKGIFYGVNRNKAGQEFSEFERYKPWNDIDFSGKIEYECDGSDYTAFRDFNRNNCKVYDGSGNDITSDFNKDKSRGAEIGVEHFGIDEETFCNTVFVKQANVDLNVQSQNTTIQKLTNMLQSGNENTSIEKIIAKLQKKLLDDVGTERTRNKPINIVRKDLFDKKQLKNKLLGNHQRKIELDDEKEKIKKQIENVDTDSDQIGRVLEVREKYINLLDDKERTHELTLKIKQKEKEDAKKKAEKQLRIWITIVVLIMIIACTFLFLFKKYIWCFAELCISVVGILIATSIKEKVEEDTFESEFFTIKEELKKKESKELEKLTNEGVKSNYTSKKVQELKTLLAGLEKKKNDLILENHKIKIEEDSMKENIEKLSDVEEQIEELESKKNLLEREEKAINVTIKKLYETYDELKSAAIPEMENNIERMIEQTTNSKYKEITYNNEDGILVQNTVGEYVPISKLSLGTIDQMYLGFRLGVATKAKDLPVILDEAFAYYDDERLENIIMTLAKLNRQIIIMTCSTRETRILDKLHLKYNYLDI